VEHVGSRVRNADLGFLSSLGLVVRTKGSER
jgi:hypothetical protein